MEASVLGILAKPIAKELVAAGKAVLLRLTDSAGIAVYPSRLFSISTMRNRPGIGKPWLSFCIPIYVTNKSKFERCMLRDMHIELVGLGDIHTPIDGYIRMNASHTRCSLDSVISESRLASEVLIESSSVNIDKLESYRESQVSLMDVVTLDPLEFAKIYVEFRAPIGDSLPLDLCGGFRMSIYTDIVFPSAITSERAELFSQEKRFDVRLIDNMTVIEQLGADFDTAWNNLPTLSEQLPTLIHS